MPRPCLRRAAARLLLLLLLLPSPCAAWRRVRLTAKCLDGSPVSFYFKAKDPQTWHIHFSGGGACTDLDSCHRRLHVPQLKAAVGGSNRWGVGPNLRWPPWFPKIWPNATEVVFKSCDGAMWMGNRKRPYTLPPEGTDRRNATVWWQGYQALTEALEWLAPKLMRATAGVWLTAHSAGGQAVLFNAERILRLVPPGARVGAFLNSPL